MLCGGAVATIGFRVRAHTKRTPQMSFARMFENPNVNQEQWPVHSLLKR
jgi:hypothetical protein